MLLRAITPLVKETNQLTSASVQRANVAALPNIASQSGIRQSVRNRCAAGLAADDVVDLMGRIGIVLVQQAILASIAGALGDELPQLVRNVTRQGACAGVPAPWP